MSEGTDSTITLSQILFEGQGEPGLANAMHQMQADEAIDKRINSLASGLRAIVYEQILAEIARVLDLDLIGVMARAWRKWEEAADAARRSVESGSTEIQELSDHTITSTHRPYVDVTLDGATFATITLPLEIEIKLHALTAEFSAGRLSALLTGRADVTATMSIESVQVAHLEQPVEIPMQMTLGSGIPLV